MSRLLDDCFLHDKDRLRHDGALDILRERVSVIVDVEEVSLEAAAGRYLADAVAAPRNIPSTDNAAVDGYAFAHADHEPTGGFFPITSRMAAGDTNTVELPGFSAARIFTGAPMPRGADTVAMQEDCETHEQDGTQFVIVPSGLRKGANCRLAGEDVVEGAQVAKAGVRLRPQEIAAIASTGTPTASVYRKLRIAVISTGDEVIRPGSLFQPGLVYDANHFMLSAFLKSLPVECSDLGVCPDERDDVRKLLIDTANDYDVILSTGGASRGEEDHLVAALEELGSCHLWQLAVKPGRPVGFGQIADTPCFTLPGNPVAAFVCFLLYVRPTITKLAGGNWPTPERFSVPAGFSISSKPDRREFLRGFLVSDENGTQAMKFDRDGSGLISGLTASTGLIEIPEEMTRVQRGEPVHFIPYSTFGIPA